MGPEQIGRSTPRRSWGLKIIRDHFAREASADTRRLALPTVQPGPAQLSRADRRPRSFQVKYPSGWLPELVQVKHGAREEEMTLVRSCTHFASQRRATAPRWFASMSRVWAGAVADGWLVQLRGQALPGSSMGLTNSSSEPTTSAQTVMDGRAVRSPLFCLQPPSLGLAGVAGVAVCTCSHC
jgi:hypothetical protein